MEITVETEYIERIILTPEGIIRQMLDDRKICMQNIATARRIIRETDAEIIEGLSMQAQDYARERVQSSGADEAITGILDRLGIERKQQRYDMTRLAAQLDAKESEIEWLDSQVFRLPADLQRSVILRFYDGKTNTQCDIESHCGDGGTKRNIKKAISIIAKNYAPVCPAQHLFKE